MQIIRVAELFAGVGGFRLGLEGWQGMSASSGYSRPVATPYRVVWSNQWEPSTRLQHASDIYEKRFGSDGHTNQDIATVKASEIPAIDMLVGGFPCQDYSVARQLGQSQGIAGKKGVLWWQIHRLLMGMGTAKPPYLLLENVDRLLKSPVAQRGRDFAIILASLSDLGYVLEWRVVNAADYGMPQRRRRTFILAYLDDSNLARKMKNVENHLFVDGVFAKALPVKPHLGGVVSQFNIIGDLVEITELFNAVTPNVSPFKNAGIMFKRKVYSIDIEPQYDGIHKVLGDILQDTSSIPDEYYLKSSELERWKYLKGAKKEARLKPNGEQFYYTEGRLPFPDPLDRPARTIVTAEGGKTPSRFKHLIEDHGRLRRLTPVELERANMFPDDHTFGARDTKRAFFMGNALVVGVVEAIGQALAATVK